MSGETPTRKRLLIQSATALTLAAAFSILVVLPAEWAIDLTGFGKLTGLNRLAGEQPVTLGAEAAQAIVARSEARPYRSDELIIPLAGGGLQGSEIEKKVWMVPGQALVFSWTSDGDVYSDFHGETLPEPQVKVMTYRILDPLDGKPGRADAGGFIAPMEGFHGWYFKNLEMRPVTVRVKLTGFYETRPYPPQ
jgi:hypothetical protein